MNCITHRWFGLGLTFLSFVFVSSSTLHATPYATFLTNNSGTVSFRLNEAADSVSIIGNGGTLTNNLGARAAGLTVTNLSSGGLTGGVVQVVVRKTGNNNPVGISTNSMNAPRGVAVNRNPASPYFGRVYVANATAGGTGATARQDGIYIYYPELTTDTATLTTNFHNGGYDFAAEGAANAGAPFHLTVGPDDRVYIGDWSDATGNLISTDPNVTSFQYVLQQLSGTATLPVGSNNTHGSVQAVAVSGTLAGGNLVVYTVDEDYAQDPTSFLLNQWNSVWVYEIGAGPLPWTNPPNRLLCVPSINSLSQNDDLAIGPNGFLYFNQRRANSTANLTTWTPSLFVIDPAVYIDYTNYGPYSGGYSNGIYDPTFTNWTGFQTNYYTHNNLGSGGWIWESQSATYEVSGGTIVDRFQDANGVSVSPDGKYIAGITFAQNPSANAIIIAPLDNGIPDMSRILIINPGTTSAGRGVCWDAANNVYMVSSGLATVRAYSLAFHSVATTGSDGTFSLVVPPNEVWASVGDAQGSEAGADTATIRFHRSGDTSGPLTVNYTITGTAANGTDYTNALGGNLVTNITFAAGQSTTNLTIVPIDDANPEASETVVLTIAGSTNYTSLFNRAGTLVIADNESAEISLTPSGASTNMYERVALDYARFTLTRRGLTNAAITVNIGYGGLVNGTDFSGQTTVQIPDGAVTQTFDLNPVDNNVINGTRPFTVNVQAAGGGEYVVNGTTNTAGGTIVDDDLPAENVIWSYDFDADAGSENVLPANWTYTFGATNNVNDFSFIFGYNYSADFIPSAPGSTTTAGLRATVNKNDAAAFAAAINLYPTNLPAFTNDYALRFNMLIIVNTTSNNTEHAIFGINHAGTKTNWNVSGGSVLNGTDQDGLFFSTGPTGGNLFDNVLFTRGTAVASPLAVSNRQATTLTHVWKNPPYFAAGQPGMNFFSGLSNTWTWLDVEVAQTTNMVALRINNTPIITSTNISPFKSGTIMLGYNDMFNSIGGFGGAVLYDNVRVVTITTPVITTHPVGSFVVAGNNVTLTSAATTTTGVTNYQWYRNGAAIAGATNATLTINNFQAANAGTYTVVVDDGRYPVTSQPAVLSVAAAPTLLVSLAGTTVTLRFNSQVGPTYYTEYKNNLTNATWTPLSTNAGTGSQITVNDTSADSATRFYRARAQ